MRIYSFSKTYAKRRVLDFAGMELQRGKIYAVIGANGSGKSTFAKLVSGVLEADRKGESTDAASVGYMPQKNFAYRMSLRANLLLAAKDEKRADMLLDAMRLKELESERADRLSGGETARMALCRLMMKNYELVILDEPTAAMDMESTVLSEKLIRQYVDKTNCALVLVTHSIQQARRIADDVMYFHKGLMLEQGPVLKMLTSPEKAETKQFLDFYGL